MKQFKFIVIDMVINITYLCVYILPVYELGKIGIIIDKYVFLCTILIAYMFAIFRNGLLSIIETTIFIVTIICCVIKKDITHSHLISIALMYRLLSNEKTRNALKERLKISHMPYVALAFTAFYSTLYLGDKGRYICTAVHDPNMSGLSLFYLFSIIREKKRKMGNILFFLGILTFSKNYLLATVIYYLFEWRKNKARIRVNYKYLSIASIFLMLILSRYFVKLEQARMLLDYASGIERFYTFSDHSNYFRFTLNSNVLYIYIEFPELLLTGMSNSEFFEYNAIYSRTNGITYRKIRPHNYFFSYLRIYGICSLFVFYFTYILFDMVLTPKNNKVSVPIFFYLIFLGIGAANYWLYISIFTLLACNSNESDGLIVNKCGARLDYRIDY